MPRWPPGAARWSWKGLFVYVIANIYTNYFNHYARTELHLPAAPRLEP